MARLRSEETEMSEPQRIDQTEFGELGNCMSACLAMMLGLRIDEVPNFSAMNLTDNQKYKAMQEWLLNLGYQLLTFEAAGLLHMLRGYCIAGGASPRGFFHAVIIKDGVLWHDPHPDRSGINKVGEIDLLIPLYPWMKPIGEAEEHF
jgi:hypothetical protein